MKGVWFFSYKWLGIDISSAHVVFFMAPTGSISLLMVLATILICLFIRICGMLVPIHNCPMEAEQRTGSLHFQFRSDLSARSTFTRSHFREAQHSLLVILWSPKNWKCSSPFQEYVPSDLSFRTQFLHSDCYIYQINFLTNGHISSLRRSNPGRWQGASFISINVYLLLLDMTDFVIVFQSQILYTNVQLIAISSI